MARLEILARSASDPGRFDTRFIAIPEKVRNESYRASLLPPEHVLKMVRQPLPKPSEFWIASCDGQDLGRIGANVSPVHEGLGYVGFFDVETRHAQAQKIAHTLLESASQWLRSQSCTRLAGPVDLSTWFSYRFSVKKTTTRPGARSFSWEPLNPPEYPAWFESFGMHEIHAYHSQGYSAPEAGALPQGADLLAMALRIAASAGFRFRPLDMAQLESREIPILHRLSHAGFTDAFLFEPIPLEIFSSLYATALRRFDFSPSCILEAPDGTPAGFCFAFYDEGTLIIKTIAVLPEFQKLKLSSALLAYAGQEAMKRKNRHFCSALIKSGSGSEHHERRHDDAGAFEWRHDYALYGMDLA